MKKFRKRPLISHSLENISKNVFKNYSSQITDLIGTSPGVYALYDDMGLYYVGKSTDLRERVNHHLKDRHKASWTNFSLYLLRDERHVNEMEALLIRIASPKGNRTRPKGRSDGILIKKLKGLVKEKQKQEFAEMFDLKVKANKERSESKFSSLVGLVKKNTQLFQTYKGTEFKAMLTPKGKIMLKRKIYSSPSAAGKSIVKHGCNGWRFWYLKDRNGDVISLDELRLK
ncbi:MAG: GIY-YIG nuclease family protein [Planctomycetes bacterium]|nr:GIY-YIG nuclease family protein [Planctomycetota bacterium]